MGLDLRIMWYVLIGVIVLLLDSEVVSNPLNLSLNQYHCPVIKDSDLEPGNLGLGSRVINMADVEGQKVRLQFFYPNGNGNRRRQQASSGETTTQAGSDDPGASTIKLDGEEIVTSPSADSSPQFDIFCQWDFRAANDSQFLLLTFEKLSAPYSENCAEAYVAMQKQNAFESRWCGNRRQANARPMALFSRGSAKVSVFRKANAPTFPSTGFTVVVETVDVTMLEGGKNSLRVLLG